MNLAAWPAYLPGLAPALLPALVLLILGVIALIRADKKDIPDVIRWLSRWGRQ